MDDILSTKRTMKTYETVWMSMLICLTDLGACTTIWVRCVVVRCGAASVIVLELLVTFKISNFRRLVPYN